MMTASRIHCLFIATLAAIFGMAACDSNAKRDYRSANEVATNPTPKKTKAPTSGNQEEEDPEEGEDDPDVLPSSSKEDTLYLAYFNTKVRDAVFNSACISCHVGPRVVADPRGPESIYVYDAMRAKLKDGTGPVANALIAKMVNVSRHPGGDVCPGGLNDAPCKAVLDWYEQEKGPITDRAALVKPQPANNKLSSISELGKAYGWAVNAQAPADAVKIKVYIDGDNASGKTPIETISNVDAYDGGADGAHGFSLDMPAAVIDGKKHTAYVYMLIGTIETQIDGSPMEFYAYQQSAAVGKPYYTANLQTAMQNACGGCHSPAYDSQWSALLSPTPAKGGTRDNNRLYQKAMGGLNHSGGNRCAGALCDNIRNWWDREFGGVAP